MQPNLFNFFKKIFCKNKHTTQTFTYFIPAPPEHKHGYREKEFDRIFFNFINQGYEILSVNTNVLNSAKSAGMWVLITVKSTNKKTKILNLDFPLKEDNLSISADNNNDDLIKDIYHIE